MFHRDIRTPRKELKIRRAAEYFGLLIQGVWIADETLYQVFDTGFVRVLENLESPGILL